MSAWNLAGRVVIACNCDLGCPCNFNARPSHGKCEGGWIWSIDNGTIDGVSVDSLGVALYADWPGAIHEGGGRAVAYLDDRADERQRAALTRLLRGEVGGPWAIFSKTYELVPLVPNGMPQFKEFTAQQRRDLRQYIRTEGDKFTRAVRAKQTQ